MAKDVTIQCGICKNDFTYRHYGESKKIRKYCSSACRIESTKNQIKIICFGCSCEFLQFPSVIKNGHGKYCSMYCAKTHRRMYLKCTHCKKDFYKYISEVKKTKTHYCSRECASKNRNFIQNCNKCSKPFHTYLSDKNRGKKFCSLLCFYESITPQEKFFKQISTETHEKKCWEWCGKRDKDNYGIISLKKRTRSHRFSWELHFGPIPEGILVCHHCDNPPCVNPDHLFLGTHKDNAQDRDKKKRGYFVKKHHT